MSTIHFALLIVVGCLSVIVGSQQNCNGANTCGECYAIPGCSWCFQPNFDSARCLSASEALSSSCPANMLDNIKGTVNTVDLELNSTNQITPKKATIRLRAGTSQNFTVSIRPAENFPFDLYMLVDLSQSLLNDLNTIKGIATDIIDTIRNISTQFQVGFGTYVDKTVPPYTSFVQFLNLDMNVQQPFSYAHNLNLTNNATSFSDGFNSLEISTNTDNPEGTFDAILQAALCDKVVGWRENARKILLVLTDDSVHTAGDGKLAGLVKPVPGVCNTVYNPVKQRYEYSADDSYDFPSVEQLRRVFTDKIIVPLFAVTTNVTGLFDIITQSLEGTGAIRAEISEDSSNIIDVITNAYRDIVSRVALSIPPIPYDAITIDRTAECPITANISSDGRECTGIEINDTTTFTVTVSLRECNRDLRGFNDSNPIPITVVVPAYGTFQIDVVPICTCSCESTAIPNSPACSSNGTLSCGVCECNPFWIGETCNCLADEVSSLQCPTNNIGLECSGATRGSCFCGDCQCNTPSYVSTINSTDYRITDDEARTDQTDIILQGQIPMRFGNSCECDNFRCPYNSTGFICSGSDHGTCECNGLCSCLNHPYGNLRYTGNTCECSEAFCYDMSLNYTSEREPCNGAVAGTCSPCNLATPCSCNSGFLPPYCVPADTTTLQCTNDLNECARCVADNENADAYLTECSCFTQYFQLLDSVKPEDYPIPNAASDTQRCAYTFPDPLCTYIYFVALANTSTASNPIRLIHIQPKSNCLPLMWWHLILILLGVLVILGIILIIIIRLIIMCLDYAELKRFQKDVAAADLSKNFNPLYQSPEVKYDNIAFGNAI